MEAGHYLTVTSKVFPLQQAAEAHRYLEAGAHLGKVILQVRYPQDHGHRLGWSPIRFLSLPANRTT
ncbi:MAG: zinc-binding dehydrogenase [Bacteroidota bacterium]